jgi:ubiquinone/menaquinone biosynthesis C-methylase UbiE
MDTSIQAGGEKTFLPAAGHDILLPLYDSVTKLIGADRARSLLVPQSGLRPGHRVLDIGCGTGTLAVLMKRRHPLVEIVGLDPDVRALERAKRKARRAAVSVRFDQGFADSLPYRGGEFDLVFSSFMLHHLDTLSKEKMFSEVRRVLKPGGHLHLIDFGGPESAGGSLVSRWIQSHQRLRENTQIKVLSSMAAAGLVDARMVDRRPILFGLAQVLYFRASAPAVAERAQ